MKMNEMPDREKVIARLEEAMLLSETANECKVTLGYGTVEDALAMLKAQDIATIQPKRIELADETKVWLDEMDAVDALGNIANICIDWDGYRTANELGGLINEIWAYARYCAKNLSEAQEPVSVQKKPMEMVGLQTWDWACGNCGQTVLFSAKFCPWCGRAVKWE